MCLTRSFSGIKIWMACLGIVALGGCQIEQRVPGPEPVSSSQWSIDQATQARNWEPSTAIYASDAVKAYPTLAPLRSKPLNYHLNIFTEPVLFLGNVAYIPVGIFLEPEWKPVIYKSMSMEPTYTAMPPLPPAAVATAVPVVPATQPSTAPAEAPATMPGSAQ